MYESKGNDAVVFPQQAVAGEQCFGEPTDAVNEVLLALAVVVQVDLDVGDSMRRHALQRFHKVGSIFLLGIEECITGRLAGRILKLCRNGRPTGGPSSDSLCPSILAGTVPERLIVIGKEQPEPPSGLTPEGGKPILDIPGEPDLAVPGKCHDAVLSICEVQSGVEIANGHARSPRSRPPWPRRGPRSNFFSSQGSPRTRLDTDARFPGCRTSAPIGE